MTQGIGNAPAGVNSDAIYAVKKSLDIQKQQGAMALKLVSGATNVGKAASNPDGTATLVNKYA